MSQQPLPKPPLQSLLTLPHKHQCVCETATATALPLSLASGFGNLVDTAARVRIRGKMELALFAVVPVRGICGGGRARNPQKIWGKRSFTGARGCLCVPVRTRTRGRWGHGGGTGVSRLFIYTVLSESTELKTGWVKLWGTLPHIEFYMIVHATICIF